MIVDSPSELFEIVDDDNCIIGTARRDECHGNPKLIHRTAHVIVYHPDGRILLQKRTLDKDIQPGRWDTAVGGHLNPGEDFKAAAKREMGEELGVLLDLPLTHLFDARIRNEIESENIRVFSTVYAGPFDFLTEEIDEIKFWTVKELQTTIKEKPGIFTPNLIDELKKMQII